MSTQPSNQSTYYYTVAMQPTPAAHAVSASNIQPGKYLLYHRDSLNDSTGSDNGDG